MQSLRDILRDCGLISSTRSNEHYAIILYGTVLSLEASSVAEYFRWIQKSLELFQNRKEIILLWYPQIKTDDWQREYGQLVREYKERGWGILVDSCQVQEAVELADAYYGDKCPISVLFKLTGKPMKFRDEDLDKRLLVETLREAGGSLWATSGGESINGLYKIDCQAFTARYQGIPAEQNSCEGNYSEILAYEGKLYLIPRKSNCLGVYDIAMKSWRAYKIDKSGMSREGERSSSVLLQLEKRFIYSPVVTQQL